MVSALALLENGDTTNIGVAWIGSSHDATGESFASSLEHVTQQEATKAMQGLPKDMLPKSGTPVGAESKVFMGKAGDATKAAGLSTSDESAVEVSSRIGAKAMATAGVGSGVTKKEAESVTLTAPKTQDCAEPNCRETGYPGAGERDLALSEENTVSDDATKNTRLATSTLAQPSDVASQWNEYPANTQNYVTGKLANVKQHTKAVTGIPAKEPKKEAPADSSPNISVASIDGSGVGAISMVAACPIDEMQAPKQHTHLNDPSVYTAMTISTRKSIAAPGCNVSDNDSVAAFVVPAAAGAVETKTHAEDVARGIVPEAVTAPVETATAKTSDMIVAIPFVADSKMMMTAMGVAGGIKTHDTEGGANLAMQGMSTAGESTEVPALPDSHGVMGATPTSLDVGIANGTHGWLKIRAEISGGAVTASLSASSNSGQEMLHRELPSLNIFLAQEQLAVKTVVVDSTLSTPSFTDTSGNSGSREDRGGQNQSSLSQGDDSQEQNLGSGSMRLWNQAEQADAYGGWTIGNTHGLVDEITYSSGSGWLSVRA